jgi:PP-loop superfamily ATP-utilizing enzyme
MSDLQRMLIKSNEIMDKNYKLNKINECLFCFLEDKQLLSEWLEYAENIGLHVDTID